MNEKEVQQRIIGLCQSIGLADVSLECTNETMAIFRLSSRGRIYTGGISPFDWAAIDVAKWLNIYAGCGGGNNVGGYAQVDIKGFVEPVAPFCNKVVFMGRRKSQDA